MNGSAAAPSAERNERPQLLLSHAYFLDEDAHEREVVMPYPPLGLLYLSSFLKRAGFSVMVHDSTFSSPEELAARLETLRPMVFGLYVTLLTRHRALDLIRLAKSLGCAVVLGGPEPGPYAAEYLRRGADVVVVGEGEETLESLLPVLLGEDRSALASVAGIVYREPSGEVVATTPRPLRRELDSIPWPDRDAIDLGLYLETWRHHHGGSTVSLITARGCPYTCSWCSHAVFGQSHRRRSVTDVADEVEWIRDRYRPDRLWYADDVFTIHRSWTLSFAAELERRAIRIPFECISRADRLDEEVVDALAQMGCFRLWIGAESGSQRILDAMQRKANVEDVIAKSHLLAARGIQVGVFIMLGYEGEELEDLEATASFLKRARPDIFLTTVAYPIKGTAYFRSVAERIVAPADWEQTTDRQLTVVGRRSRRYYEYATRWLVHDVNRHLARERGSAGPLRRLRMGVAATLGRLGMRVFENEREQPLAPSGRGWAEHEARGRRVSS